MISILETGDYISLLEIIINILIIIFIANFIQNKETSSRTLKDYFITELNSIMHRYEGLFDCLEKDFVPSEILNDFTNDRSKLNNLLTLINDQYKINYMFLISDILAIQVKVEDDENFANNYSRNINTKLISNTIVAIQNFRYDSFEKEIFKLIIDINNHTEPILKLKK